MTKKPEQSNPGDSISDRVKSYEAAHKRKTVPSAELEALGEDAIKEIAPQSVVDKGIKEGGEKMSADETRRAQAKARQAADQQAADQAETDRFFKDLEENPDQ